MRLPSSRCLRRAVGITAGGLVVGGAAVYSFQRYTRSDAAADGKAPVASLTAAEFNAYQNQDTLRQALDPRHMPWTYHKNRPRGAAVAAGSDPLAANVCTNPVSTECTNTTGCCWFGAKRPSRDDYVLDMYRLLGCPYCAKVEAVLRFYDVPYRTIVVDPINAKELPDARYSFAPQLRFTSSASPEKTAFLVDSHTIVSALAAPLGYQAALQSPRVSATREWIDSHFQGASFAMVNGTLRDAYTGYLGLTPPAYHTTLFHLVGTAALYLLATYKIGPRVLATAHPLNDAYARSRSSARGTPPQDTAPAHYTRPARTEDWLREELSVFLSQRQGAGVFHGGAQPDLADIEMYGVTRVLHSHSRFVPVVQSGEFGAWQRAMESVKMERNGYL